jgi:ring-1,2-phenylacetyl-CoA epoxidase subunit PaaA
MSEAERAFQARIDADVKIEPTDAMPDAYRRTLVRQIQQHAHSEIVGMLPEGNWIGRAPHARAQGDPDGQGAGRGGHGLYLYCARGDARRVARPADRRPARGKVKYSSIFNYRRSRGPTSARSAGSSTARRS